MNRRRSSSRHSREGGNPQKGAKLIEQWAFFKRPFKNVTKVIGIAPAKDHNLCHASLGIKNWYGLLGGRRNQFHQDIHEIVSDLSIMIRPTLTIVDGTRVLMENGPTGGDPANVRDGNAILVGLDPVAMDAWAFEHLLQRRDGDAVGAGLVGIALGVLAVRLDAADVVGGEVGVGERPQAGPVGDQPGAAAARQLRLQHAVVVDHDGAVAGHAGVELERVDAQAQRPGERGQRVLRREPAGAASMRLFEGVAQLTGAATLPEHRRRGVQSALLAARLADAAAARCDVAVVTTQPGSKSHENVQRQGFELLYARAILVREPSEPIKGP